LVETDDAAVVVVSAHRRMHQPQRRQQVFIPTETYTKIEIHSAFDQHPFLSEWMAKAAPQQTAAAAAAASST